MVARVLLPAGLERMPRAIRVREGGLDATRDDLLTMVRGASAIVPDPSVPIDAEVLEAAGDRLKVIANFAVGYDNIDLDACRERGIVVTNTPDVLTEATAELAMALTFAAARRMSDAERDLRAGGWGGWDPAADLGIEIAGRHGGRRRPGPDRRPLRAARSRDRRENLYTSQSPKPEAESGAGRQRQDLSELLEASDVVSIHAPSTPETRGLIGAAELELIGPEGVLVNTSRGPLVDSEAVAAALQKGTLGAAGLDVYENEPEVSPRLLDAPRAVLLPHIGSATVPSRDGMATKVADNVIAVLEGEEPPSRVV